jgi:hypothetical protein
MAWMTVSGAQARRYVRMAQMGALALGVSAAALWALQVPGLQEALPQKPEVPPVAPVQPIQRAQEGPALDSEGVLGVAERLELGARIERAAAPVDAGPVEAPAAATAAQWKYVSFMRDGASMMAVMSHNGKQKILKPGRSWNGVRLVSVDEQKAVLQDDAGRHTIQRSERGAGSVEWRQMASNALGASANGRNPVLDQQMRYRGMDPEQAQRAREVMRQRFADRRDGGPRGLAGYPPEVLAQLGLDPKSAAGLSEDEMAGYLAKAEAILMEQQGMVDRTDNFGDMPLEDQPDVPGGMRRDRREYPEGKDGEIH